MELEPRQARSRRTRRELLEAAAGLVAREGVAGTTVADIAREAGTSVGNVYRRFSSKADLIRAMEAEFLHGGDDAWTHLLDSERWKGRKLSELVRAVVDRIVRRHRHHRGLLRAMALEARAVYEERTPAVGVGPPARLADLILGLWPGEVSHPEPRRAVALAFETVAATAGELILFRRGGCEPLGLDDEGLARELARTVYAYLCADPSSAGELP